MKRLMKVMTACTAIVISGLSTAFADQQGIDRSLLNDGEWLSREEGQDGQHFVSKLYQIGDYGLMELHAFNQNTKGYMFCAAAFKENIDNEGKEIFEWHILPKVAEYIGGRARVGSERESPIFGAASSYSACDDNIALSLTSSKDGQSRIGSIEIDSVEYNITYHYNEPGHGLTAKYATPISPAAIDILGVKPGILIADAEKILKKTGYKREVQDNNISINIASHYYMNFISYIDSHISMLFLQYDGSESSTFLDENSYPFRKSYGSAAEVEVFFPNDGLTLKERMRNDTSEFILVLHANGVVTHVYRSLNIAKGSFEATQKAVTEKYGIDSKSFIKSSDKDYMKAKALYDMKGRRISIQEAQNEAKNIGFGHDERLELVKLAGSKRCANVAENIRAHHYLQSWENAMFSHLFLQILDSTETFDFFKCGTGVGYKIKNDRLEIGISQDALLYQNIYLAIREEMEGRLKGIFKPLSEANQVEEIKAPAPKL